ncbi:MAG: hypothetical protein OXG62_05180 [Nitrospinae bacterium]|nr:hypothetical protein [Nitrospinota bacterium]
MKMLKLLGLMVFVVCIAAFASGCGGGGGGSATMPDPETPVMECPQGQVGTYPDCMDPPPTDAERIAAARDILANILTDARNLALAADTAAAVVAEHPDATAEQIASARVQADAAQAALNLIVDIASSAGDAAITLAQAQMAVADAQAALADLTAAQSTAAAVQSAVEAVASQREQMRADVIALTNGSSLIQHVRANKLLSDALLEDLVADRLLVGGVGSVTTVTINADDSTTETCTAPCATFPANTAAATGQRTVQVPAGTPLVSDSTTPALTGTSRLPYGFDLDNGTPTADPTVFVNAYTDITQTRLKVRTRTNALEDDTGTPNTDERYTEENITDADYLVAGIWLTVDNAALGNSTIQAFAYGSQPIPAAPTLCSGLDGPTNPTSSTVGTTTTTRTCANPTEFNQIVNLVDDGKDFTATYTGDANGAYIAGGETSYFTGSVSLTAEFINPTGGTTDGRGSIQGAVTNITAGGQQMAGSIELQKQTLGNDISPAFDGGTAVGVVDNKSFSGDWKGQFFNMRYTKTVETESVRDTNADPVTTATTITTEYSPEAPGSVAGTFFVKQLSNPAGEAAFIGAFGAHR